MSESPTEHFEHAEHAKHVALHGDSFTTLVSITIALLAVVAATVGSLETLESGAAISAKNEAVLYQNKATDQWNFFQAKSLKKNMYDIAASVDGPKKDDFLKTARRNEEEGVEIQKEAKKLEEEATAKLEEGSHHEHLHHRLTIAVTLLHVAIAVATIAIIAGGKRWPWFASILLGVGGTIAAASAYLG
ncbi:MAG: DUF4337 family protein [Ancalomicrobiaceae bacterium]|nr:DUF4337 family protein [Ancalomicrobiaceae bacterium]